MEAFPDFMKASLNHIDSSQQNTPDIDGYYYEGKDGSQIWVRTEARFVSGLTFPTENRRRTFTNSMNMSSA